MVKEFDFVSFIPKDARGIGVACIMFVPKKGIYLTERKKDNQFGCPGGKVESSDFTLEDAIRRELLEETGLSVDDDRLEWIGYQKVTTEATDFTCWYAIVLQPDETPAVTEPEKHGEWKLYKPQESLKLPLFCGTKQILETMIKWKR